MWEQFWEMLTCCCVRVTHSHPRQEEVKVWGEGLGVSPEEESSKSTIHSPLSPAKHPAGQWSLSAGWRHLQEQQQNRGTPDPI